MNKKIQPADISSESLISQIVILLISSNLNELSM